MKPSNISRNPLILLGAALASLLVGGLSCSNREILLGGKADTVSTLPAQISPTSVWDALMSSTPVAHTTPLPPGDPTPLDGTYAHLVESEPQYWLCLRCADYRPAGGIWKLQFERGVMRILYDVTGWRSLASYTVDGDRLTVFNDPYCPDLVGEYLWKVQDGVLRLKTVSDSCSFSLRSENLSLGDWLLCPDEQVLVHQPSGSGTPPGCANALPPEALSPPADLEVVVFPGDSRFFEKPPNVIVHANSEDVQPPEGIFLSHHGNSIFNGLNRVLWWRGNWIEMSTALPFTSMGVQFLGTPYIGWARVIFDGQEVWRGDTAAIWSKNGRHGGFIEISGFEPGRHTLRVESLDFDYRPVTVASFGFR